VSKNKIINQSIEFRAKCCRNEQSKDETLSQNIQQKNRKFCDNATPNNLMTNQQNQQSHDVTLHHSVNGTDQFDDEAELSQKNVKKPGKLNKNALIFEPKAKQQSKLASISEHETLSPAPSISSVSSLITQSSISSNSYSINSSSSSSYSCLSGTTTTINTTNTAHINQNDHPMTSGFIAPCNNLIFPVIPNIAQNTNCLGTPCMPAPYIPIASSLMPIPSTQPFSIQNAQFNQSIVINPYISNQFVTVQPRDDIITQCSNNVTHQTFEHSEPIKHTEHGGDEEKKTSTSTFFQQKLSNPAKGNFYISKLLVSRMMKECIEQFVTDHINDEKIAFAYYKESVAIQINDKQINIISTEKGLIIIINIDLHFCSNGNTMYLVATENDSEFIDRVRWKIVDFMDEYKLYDEYRISCNQLPKSSRNMNWFKRSINNPPINIPKHIIYNTNFKSKPSKVSKITKPVSRTRISQKQLKNCCLKSWNNQILIPVIVIKGKKQWVEWKKLIEINGNNNQWIGISLRYYTPNKQWQIECMDYDIGRIFYQHRLCGLNQNDKYNYSYTDLSQYNIIALDIINHHAN